MSGPPLSAREELIKLMATELAVRARYSELPEETQEPLLRAIHDQITAALPGLQAWLADDILIAAVIDELQLCGLDHYQALQATYRVLSRIDKEVEDEGPPEATDGSGLRLVERGEPTTPGVDV